MDHSYDSLDMDVRNDNLSARSMRVVKQERTVVIDRDEKSRKQRKRALVACNRCRKRKIKCNGDLNTGLACTSCRTVGATECQYSRVNSLSPEEVARCFVKTTNGRSTLLSMGSPQIRAPYQREEYDMDHSQSNFSRQPVMDSLNYDDQSSAYPHPSNYLLSNNPADYPWANRWDPALRPATSEFFEEPMPQAYNFVLPQSQPQAQVQVPQVISTDAPTTYPDTDRTLPTPTSRPSPPDLLMTDTKPFWPRYPERMPYQQTQPQPHSQPRIKSDDPDLVFNYIPMATTDEPTPIPAPTPYLEELDYSTDRRYRDAGQRVLALSSDCTPDVYGYSSGRKNERATLMNGLAYTRVRHPDSYSFLPDSMADYGRLDVHRAPTLPLGHQDAY